MKNRTLSDNLYQQFYLNDLQIFTFYRTPLIHLKQYNINKIHLLTLQQLQVHRHQYYTQTSPNRHHIALYSKPSPQKPP